jgi:ethanolamine permease
MSEIKQLQLSRSANASLLWGLAISAVMVGEFSGWNAGLNQGGIGGMLIATLLVAVMFGCLSMSLAELSTSMPFVGGGYAYARAAFGKKMAVIAGTSQLLEYVFALTTILVVIGIEIMVIFEGSYFSGIGEPFIWIFVLIAFVVLNTWDTKLFFRSAFVLAIAPLIVLGIFWAEAIPRFELDQLLSIKAGVGDSEWLPNGMLGIAWAMPFAVWFFLKIEIITLASEETVDPSKNIPKSFLLVFIVLVISALGVLVLNSGVAPGAGAIGSTNAPLLSGLETVLGGALSVKMITALVLIGALAGFHSTIYAASRVVFSLARAQYLPVKLAQQYGQSKTPKLAVYCVAILVFLLALLARNFSEHISVVALLLNMSVLAAMLSYIISLISYVLLRVKYPDMERPYKSPLGITGAITGLIIVSIAAIFMFTNSDYRFGLIILSFIYSVSLLIYIVRSKNGVSSTAPEEAFSINLHKKSFINGTSND